MNLIPGEVQEGRFRGGPVEVELPAGAPVGPALLGVRPEEISISEIAEPGCFGARVELAEPVGERGHVHLLAAELELRASITGARAFTLAVGDRVHLRIATERLHLFEVATGERLALTGSS